jgi:hypothetical protein
MYCPNVARQFSHASGHAISLGLVPKETRLNVNDCESQLLMALPADGANHSKHQLQLSTTSIPHQITFPAWK